MTRPRALAVAAVVVALGAAGGAAAQEVEGFAEGRLSLQLGVDGVPWQAVERVRPTFSAALFPRMTLSATVEAGLAQGRDPLAELERVLRASDAWPVLEAAGFRAPTYENELLRIDDRHGYLDVDRLHLDLYAGSVDMRIGRQALNWGSAQFFNPTDPFPEVLLAEPWRPRRGVNAVRASVPLAELGDTGSVDATIVAAVDDTLTVPRAAGRVRVNVLGTDVSGVAVFRGPDQDALLGVDVRGTFVVGYWVEAAVLFPENPHEEIAVGIDYSFDVLERLTLMAQYYRNGAGAREVSGLGRGLDPGGVARPSSGARNDDPFAPFVRGRDYLLAAGNLGVLEELSVSVAALQNLGDGSGMVIPTASWFPLDWLEVAGSATVPYALTPDGGELRPAAKDLVLEIPVGAAAPLTVDLASLAPDATVTLWTRVHY